MWVPSRRRRAWGITLMPTMKSPAGPPLRPMSPWPRTEMAWPLSMPAGTFTWTFFCRRTPPLPPQALHFWWMIFPSPRQLGQTVEVDMVPKTVRCCTRTWPVPWHSGQTSAVVPGSQPVPPQTSQLSTCWMVTSFSQPKAASSRVRFQAGADGGPLGRAGAGAGPAPAKAPKAAAAEEGPEEVPHVEPAKAPEAAAGPAGAEVGVHPGKAELVVAGRASPCRRGPRRPR